MRTLTGNATPAQVMFILDLMGESKTPLRIDELCRSMTKQVASSTIERLKKEQAAKRATERAARPAQAPAVEAGTWHILDGAYFLVVRSQRSGSLYVKERRTEGGFEYAPGVIGKLSESTKLKAGDAARFGELTHRCVFCYLPLDTPESLTAGYGPVCAEKNGLPWG